MERPSVGPARQSDGSLATIPPQSVIANATDITGLLDGTTYPDFPPRAWLGYGLDMTTVTPVDITSVASNVLTLSRLINLEEGGKKIDLGGVTWIVPSGVNANEDLTGGEGVYKSYASGEEAYKAISGDSSVAARYLAVTGGVSAGYAVQKSFQKNRQYGMLAYNDVLINVKFDSIASAINEGLLRQRIDRIGKWNPNNLDLVEDYRTLFRTLGSHVITGANYGSRLQLTVWSDNDNQQVDQNFNVDVGVEFNGLTTDGKVEAGVKGSSQFRTFEGSMGKASSCKGGDRVLANSIDTNPRAEGIFDTYLKWIDSTNTQPNVMSFQTMYLWDLMVSAKDSELARRATDLRNAYQWIVENPKQHVTRARMVITSDWAVISLATPSAYIMRDISIPKPEGATFTTTAVEWNSGGRGKMLDITVECVPTTISRTTLHQLTFNDSFIIRNDGSPVDLELSHGSGGSISVTFGPEETLTALQRTHSLTKLTYLITISSLHRYKTNRFSLYKIQTRGNMSLYANNREGFVNLREDNDFLRHENENLLRENTALWNQVQGLLRRQRRRREQHAADIRRLDVQIHVLEQDYQELLAAYRRYERRLHY
ncbi:MAG: hypothetical protein Q9200_004411 [Gallowayella weberi]